MPFEKIFILNRLWKICEYKPLNIFLLLSIFIFSFLCPIFYTSNPDIWARLKTGEIIWQNKDIPKKDIFSHTCEGRDWVNNEWLYQVVVYFLYSIANSVFDHHPQKSFAFLIIFQGVLLSIITFFLLSSILQKGMTLPISVASTLLVLLALEDRLQLRSEIYSLFFIVLYLWLFDRFRQKDLVPNPFASLRINSVKGLDIIFLLPFLQWLWLLMHGAFVIGFFLIALFLVSELIAKAVYSIRNSEFGVRCSVFGVQNSELGVRSSESETKIPQSEIPNSQPDVSNLQSKIYNLKSTICNYISPPISNKQLKKLTFAFFLSLILPLLNPFFHKAYLLPFRVQFGEEFKIMRNYIMEWIPIDSSATSEFRIYLFISIVILSLAGFVLQKEKRNIFYYLLFFSVLPMPFVNIRHIGIFAVSSTLPIALGIQSISQRLALLFKKEGQVKRASFLVSIIILLLSIWLIQARIRRPAFGIGVDILWFPVKASEFLKQADIKGPMFNLLGWGNYLLWKLHPKYKTFIDGRNVMQENEILGKYIAVENAKPEWEKTLAQYNVNFIIIFLFSSKHLLAALDASPNWSLIYFDDISSIYLRKTPANLNLIRKYGYRAVNLLDQSLSYIKNAISLDSAIAEFKRKVSEDPSCVIAHTFLAALLERKGKLIESENEYRFACEYAKDDTDTLINLAGFYLRYGRADFALAEALKAYKKASYSVAAHAVLGECYLAQNESKKAKRHFRKALKLNPDNPSYVFANIGICYAQEGNLEKAKEKFTSAIRLNPFYLPARLNLAKCYKEQLNLDAAELELNECLKIFPNSAESFYNLASVKFLQGNQKEAIKLLRESIKLGGGKFTEQAVKDPDFASLQENKEFRRLIEQR